MDLNKLNDQKMNSNIKTVESFSQFHARTGRVLNLVLVLIGIFAMIFFVNKIIVSGDATGTGNNLMTSESLWRYGIAADRVMHVLDAPITWINYFFSC